jgi:hypothetical protein
MAKKMTLLEAVKARTEANVVKSRSGSGKTTYLDRFVDVLTDDNGNPTEPKERVIVIAEISAQILEEQLIKDGTLDQFELTEAKDGEFDIMLADINRKVKAQVASAVADNNNSTSISYNENYKDKWEVVKDGKNIALVAKG